MTWKQHTSMWKDAVKEQEINNYSSLLYKILIGGGSEAPNRYQGRSHFRPHVAIEHLVPKYFAWF